MAKEKSTKTTKKVGIKVLASLNLGFYGPEPIYDRLLTSKELSEALTWYNYNMDDKDGIKFAAQYLESIGNKEDAKLVTSGNLKYFPASIGRIARIILMGGQVPDYAMDNFNKALEDGKARFLADKDLGPKVIYKDEPHLNERNVVLLDTILSAIETQSRKFKVTDYLTKENVPADKIEKIGIFLKDELNRTKSISPGEVKLIAYMTKIVDSIYAMIGKDPNAVPTPVVKKPRKPRKKKIIPPEKLAAKVKISMDYKDLDLKGIAPKDIIGKNAVWIYDTRYSKLTRLVGADGGLSIKGSTITNFDEKQSESKRVGRKAKVATNEVVNGGKVALRHVFDQIKSQPIKFTGRLSANNIILRVEK